MPRTRLRRFVSALERFPFDTRTHLVGLLALIAYWAYQAVVFRADSAAWDWQKISALVLILIWIRVAGRIDDMLTHTLRRLRASGVLACSEDELRRLNGRLASLKRTWGPLSGLAVGPAIVLAFAAGWQWGILNDRLALLIVEAPIFYAAGYYAGWMVVQGRLARVLRTLGIRYSVQPGHPDGAAGLRVLGDFYLRQAMLAGVPAAYLGLWILLQHPVELSRIFLPLLVFIEAAAFLWPMWAFHRVMVRQKRAFATQADEIAHRISSAQAELRKCTDPDRVKQLNARLAVDLKLYEDLEGLPTWPVSKQIRRRFALQNLVLVAIPVLGLAGGETFLAEALKAFFGGG